MPTLKQISCSIEWSNVGTIFSEYGTVYGDGLVETFIAVPEAPQPFSIHVVSKGYIAEGLAAIVYIDGNYQCNRNRVNLHPLKAGAAKNSTEVDFRLRQKEIAMGDGTYIGREWRFDAHNLVEDSAIPDGVTKQDLMEHFSKLGDIEVLIFRCRSRDNHNHKKSYSGSSSGADSAPLASRSDPDHNCDDSNDDIGANGQIEEKDRVIDLAGVFGLDGGPPQGLRWNGQGPPVPNNGQNQNGNQSWQNGHGAGSPPILPIPPSRGQYPNRGNPHRFQGPSSQGMGNKRVHFDYGNHHQPGPPPINYNNHNNHNNGRTRMTGGHVNNGQNHPHPELQWKSQQNGAPPIVHPNEWNGYNHYPAQSDGQGQYQQYRAAPPPPNHWMNHGPNQPQAQHNSWPTNGQDQQHHNHHWQYQQPAPGTNYRSHGTNQGGPQQQNGQKAQPYDGYAPVDPGLQYNGQACQMADDMYYQEGYHSYDQQNPNLAPIPFDEPPPVPPPQAPGVPGPQTPFFIPPYHHNHPYYAWAARNSSNNSAGSPLSAWIEQELAAVNGGRRGSGDPARDENNENEGGNSNGNDNTNTGNGGGNDTDWVNGIGDQDNDNQQNGDEVQEINDGNDWSNGNPDASNDASNGDGNNDRGSGDNQSNGNNDAGGAGGAGGDGGWGDSTDTSAANGGWDTDNNSTAQNSKTQQSRAHSSGLSGQLRPMFGPHGAYYSYQPSEPVEAEVEEEPRYDVPHFIAERNESSRQVQPGRGYRYFHRRDVPVYIDTVAEPYARFIFKYRTKDQLKAEIGHELNTDPTSSQAAQPFHQMDKQKIIDMLVRAQVALGGKIPSPPPKVGNEGEENARILKPVPIRPPNTAFLKYSLPAFRNVSNAGPPKGMGPGKKEQKKVGVAGKGSAPSWDANSAPQRVLGGWETAPQQSTGLGAGWSSQNGDTKSSVGSPPIPPENTQATGSWGGQNKNEGNAPAGGW